MEKQKQKVLRREETKQRRSQVGPNDPGGVDPDIAGIVPGPQPNPWLDDLEDEPTEDSDSSEDDEGRG